MFLNNKFAKLFFIYALLIVAVFLYGVSDRFFVANVYEIEFPKRLEYLIGEGLKRSIYNSMNLKKDNLNELIKENNYHISNLQFFNVILEKFL